MANNIRAVSPSLFFSQESLSRASLSLFVRVSPYSSVAFQPSRRLCLVLPRANLIAPGLSPLDVHGHRRDTSRYATSGVASRLLLLLLLILLSVVRARSRMCGTKVAVFCERGTYGGGDFCPMVSAKRGVIRGLPSARSLYVINNHSCKNACAIQNCGLLDCGLNRGPIY